MSDKHWKRFERTIAKLFGLRRVPLSGGTSGHGTRADLMRKKGDTRRLLIYFELKHLARTAVHTLMDKTRELAKAENRYPVVILGKRGERGGLVVFDLRDFGFVVPLMWEMWTEAQTKGGDSEER